MKLQNLLIIFLSFQIVTSNKKQKDKNQQPKEEEPLTNYTKLQLQCQQSSKETLTFRDKVVENQPYIDYGDYQIFELENSTPDQKGILVYKIKVNKNQKELYYQAAIQIIEQLQQSGTMRQYFGQFQECYVHKYRNVIQYDWYSMIYIIIKSDDTKSAIKKQHVNFKLFSNYRFSIKFFYFKKLLKFYYSFVRRGIKNIKMSPRYIYNFNEKGFNLNLMLLGTFMIPTKDNPNPQRADLFNQISPRYEQPNLNQNQLTETQISARDQFNFGVIFIELFGLDFKKDLKKDSKCLTQITNNCLEQVTSQLVYKNYKQLLKKDQDTFMQKFFKNVLEIFFAQIDNGQFLDTLDNLQLNQFFLDYYDLKQCSKDQLQTKTRQIPNSVSGKKQDMKIYILDEQKSFTNFSYLIFQDFHFYGYEPDFFLQKDDNVLMIKDQLLNKTSELRIYLATLNQQQQQLIVDRVIHTQTCSFDGDYIYIKIELLKGSLYSGQGDSFYEVDQQKKFDNLHLFHQALSDYIQFISDMNSMGIKVLNLDPNIVYYTTIPIGITKLKSKVIFLPQTLTEIFKYNKKDAEKRTELCKRLYQAKQKKSLVKYCSKKKPISNITEAGLVQIATMTFLSIFDNYDLFMEFAFSFLENQYEIVGIGKIGKQFSNLLKQSLAQGMNFSHFISHLNSLNKN